MLSRRTQLTKNRLLKRSPYQSTRPKSTLSYRKLTFSSIVGSTPSVLSRFLNTLFDFVGGSRRGLQYTSTTPSPEKLYKRKSQEKHFALRRKFSDFPAPVNERGWF